MDEAPLIVALELNDAAFERLNALRALHFPPERNVLAAHLTLFHKLPGGELPAVAAALRGEAVARAGPIRLEPLGPKFIGRGVALFYASAELDALRARLAGRFAPWLTAQDRQKHRPHVTVQNKAEPKRARALAEALSASPDGFVPAFGTGLALWRYLGGPWEEAGRFRFG